MVVKSPLPSLKLPANAPENGGPPGSLEIAIGNHHFEGAAMLVSGRVIQVWIYIIINFSDVS